MDRAGQHKGRVVYFATGTVAEVAADLNRLNLGGNSAQLRVVVPANYSRLLPQFIALKPEQVIPFQAGTAALLWFRLFGFLGFYRGAEVYCLTSKQHFRFLKFLALSLRGRVVFRHTDGASIPLSLATLASLWFRRRWNAREERMKPFPIGVIGSASPESMERIVPAVRSTYPGTKVHGLLLSSAPASTALLFDSVRILQPGFLGILREGAQLFRGKGGYQRWIVPCTNEPYAKLKFLAFLWPLNRRQIYNEYGDGFPARSISTLWRHFRWRKEAAIARLPIGIIGSASGYYLERIIAVLRAQFPGIRVHGLLLTSAAPATASLFDSVDTFQPGLWSAMRQGWRFLRAKNEYQRWIIPCTIEPYGGLKFMAFLWPLRRRQIYNEQADGFAVRDLQTLLGHIRWRLRDHMSFQFLAGSAELSFPMRIAHLSLYTLRILSAIPWLWLARLRSYRNHWTGIDVRTPVGSRRWGGAGWNEKNKASGRQLAASPAVASRIPTEPGGSVGLE